MSDARYALLKKSKPPDYLVDLSMVICTDTVYPRQSQRWRAS